MDIQSFTDHDMNFIEGSISEACAAIKAAKKYIRGMRDHGFVADAAQERSLRNAMVNLSLEQTLFLSNFNKGKAACRALPSLETLRNEPCSFQLPDGHTVSSVHYQPYGLGSEDVVGS